MAIINMEAINKEKGNVLFVILVAVALFALLSFVITKDNAGSDKMKNDDKDSLYASEIIAYGNSVKLVIEQMRTLKGISDNNEEGNGVLFSARDANSDYGDPDTQPSTEVFNINGGKIEYQQPMPAACNKKDDCVYEFSGQYNIPDIGDNTKAELSMIVVGLTESVCIQINRALDYGWNTTIPTDKPLTLDRFSGTNYIDNGDTGSIEIINESLKGKGRFCYKEESGEERYIYVHVVNAR